MILKDVLREVVKSQKKELSAAEIGIKREKLKSINIMLPFAVIISGIRRCGKSTLLRQIITTPAKVNYFHFEDIRILGFEVTDFDKLVEVFKEENPDCDQYFFDEIQNVPKWEILVRGLLNNKKHVVITGSNASLLSKELGTRLTGRHLKYELFPFSYKEALKLLDKKKGIDSFELYFKKGGFPEFLKYEKIEILQELLNDIISRDIIVRHKLRSEKIVKEMALYLFTNVAKKYSFNSLKKLFKLGSVNTAKSFVSYFEDSYLLFSIPKFDYSLKKQLVNPKKVYAIDVGLASSVSVSFSEDAGRMLENVVFLHLRRKFPDIFYYNENRECDFVVKEKQKITQAIQVCYNVDDENKHRELDGLVEAMKAFKLKKGYVLTYNQHDKFLIDGCKIIVKPVWEWLLE